MEMNNLPICAPFLDHKRDTTVGAEGLSIAHTCHGIHPSYDDCRIRQDHGRMIADRRASRTVNQESRLEVLADLLGLGNKGFTSSAQEKGIGRIEFDYAINVGLRERRRARVSTPVGRLSR